jgi:hypothetical protein
VSTINTLHFSLPVTKLRDAFHGKNVETFTIVYRHAHNTELGGAVFSTVVAIWRLWAVASRICSSSEANIGIAKIVFTIASCTTVIIIRVFVPHIIFKSYAQWNKLPG